MSLKSTFTRFLLVSTVSGLSACAMGPHATSASSSASSLSAYHWDLTDAKDARGVTQTQWVPPPTQNGQPLRFSFSEQRLSVEGLCNRLGAGYDIHANNIKISPAVSTMMACDNAALMQYEQALGKRLPQAKAWSIAENSANPSLTLRFEDGAHWTLSGTPTDETRYGSVGDTLFLEVASQRVACSHPGMPTMQCLRVRDIQYDTQGIKTGQGDWQAFYSDIEGYTHQPGVRNVLRVKRYERVNVPADASRYAYTLDMVVESAQE